MAEEFDKSEEATPYKLQEARKKGQVGKSSEFTGFFSLFAMVAGVVVFLGSISHVIVYYTVAWFKQSVLFSENIALALPMVNGQFVSLMAVLGPILLVGVAVSIIVSIAHAGVVFSLFPLKPDFSRLSPAKGFKRVFSLKTLVEIIKLILKFIFFALILKLVWAKVSSQVATVGSSSVSVVIQNWKAASLTLVFSVMAAYFLFALFDLWYSKRDFKKQMRMSKRDLKDEYKKREGDPEVKSQRKKKQSELLKRIESLGNIKDADLIVTNPTHYAIALKFRAKSMPLPMVISKGKGHFARLVRINARRYNVPIIRQPKLARELYNLVALQNYIPIESQTEVADLYKEVIHLPGCKVYQ